MMYEAFRCIVSFLSIYFIVVLGIVLYKQCSVGEARKMFWKFMKDALIVSCGNPCIYPVIVGEFNGRIIPDTVNKSFSKLGMNFDVFYFMYHQFSKGNDCILYVFAIQRKIDSPLDEELEILLQKQSEEVVTKTMQSYDCNIMAEPLTLVELRENELRVVFARTPQGIAMLDKQKELVRNRRVKSKIKTHSNEFTEDWNNEN